VKCKQCQQVEKAMQLAAQVGAGWRTPAQDNI
jgi:hypothetical protein